jgi:hypothetical protein
LRVLVRQLSEHELLLDNNGISDRGEHYEDIIDVLDDKTADEYEKTRTIVVCMQDGDSYSSPVKEMHQVFVFSDTGAITFEGRLGDVI